MQGLFTATNIILFVLLIIIWSFCIKALGYLNEMAKNSSMTEAEKKKERGI